MNFESPNTTQAIQSHGSLLVLAALALLVGIAAGVVGALFRLALEHADQWRNDLITWAQEEGPAGFFTDPAMRLYSQSRQLRVLNSPGLLCLSKPSEKKAAR
jgi:hypothetical protein